MVTANYRGVEIPEPGDDLLAGLSGAFASAGVVTVAASVAAARLALTEAEAGGAVVSPARPVYFNVGGIFYVADGAKQSGVWTLKPVNETELVVDTYVSSGPISRAAGSQHLIVESTLPVRPYDRAVKAWGMLNGAVTGVVGARILILNKEGATARWESGASAETVSVVNAGIVPAGTAPQVILALSFGGLSSSTVNLSASADANRLIVEASPITMAGA